MKQMNSSGKAHGNLTPAWFSCSRTHCLRRFFHARAMAEREYHYHNREVMAAALPKAAYGTLTGFALSFPPFGSWRVSPSALSLLKGIRLLLFDFQRTADLTACQNTLTAVCFDRMTRQTSPFGKRGSARFHERNYGYLISKDKILVISLVSILLRKVSSTTIC